MAKSKGNIKKGFFEVAVPMTSSKVALYGESPESLNGRVVKLDLTRSLKGKSLELKFKVKTENGMLVGEPMGVELAGSYIRRMMRKGVDYVEDSFVVECKDCKAVVKPFMITRNRVSRGIRNSLRIETKKHLEAQFKGRTAKEIFSEIMANKIQRELSFKLKKVYPLALCEIRVFKLIEENVALTKAAS
jgi:ribosomal protein S3AE